MARSKDKTTVEIPRYLYEVLDQVAEHRNTPTNRLIARWLWEQLQRYSDDPNYPGNSMRDVRQPYDPTLKIEPYYPRRRKENSHV